ncbi:dynamin family protein [Streptomyces sp. H27-D2]|uniref:dynamin family protein n=1 Tax=Streptomyces sp. H27-D2 TaxID=3046304 RepID=UPI002DB8FD27|nr:dynamin family protein [Streptomyces sp. H27-D2]MEC4019394.1 dynamin family protein [Streptomyces sp. H27-D2]
MRDNAFTRLRADVLAAFPRVTETLSGELGPRQQELIEQSLARLEQGTCHIVVAGEYKRGKSTLLNALVERPGLFPVDVDVATCVVSTLAWGPQEQAVVHMTDAGAPDGSGTRQVGIGLDRLPEFVTEQGNPRNHKQVRLVEIQAPVPQLENGLVFMDTPGVGSLNPEHTAVTHAFLERADGLVFVCDAIEPLATYELDFLERALARCEVVVTVVTKTDKVRDPVPVITGAREKIAARTDRPAERLVVVPVSSFRKLKWLRDRTDDQLLADSNFPELDLALWEGLATTCGAVQLRRALDALGDALAMAGSPVVNELAALESDESLRRIRREVTETTGRIKELSAGGAKWRTDLRRRFDEDTRPARAALQTAFDAGLRDYHEKVNAGADPGADEVVGQVTSHILKALTEAHDRLAAVAVALMAEFARQTSLELTSPQAPKPPFSAAVSVPSVPLNMRPARFFDQFRASWSTGMAGVGTGAAVAFVEPLSGLAVMLGLGTMGFVHGVRNHRKDLRERAEKERNARLLQLITQEFGVLRRRATESFTQTYGDIAQSLTEELNSQLAAQQESLTESGRRLQEATGRTKAELTGRRGELLTRQQIYRNLQGELDRLRARVERLASAPPRGSLPAGRRPELPGPDASATAPAPAGPGTASTARGDAAGVAAEIALGVTTEAALGAAVGSTGADGAGNTSPAFEADAVGTAAAPDAGSLVPQNSDAPASRTPHAVVPQETNTVEPQDPAVQTPTTPVDDVDTDVVSPSAQDFDASFDPDLFDAP